RLRHRLRAEEIVGRVLVLKGGSPGLTLEHAMDVRKKEISRFADVADLVLNMDGQLEIVLPVLALVAIVGQQRIVDEYARPLEIETKAVKNDDVRRDDEKIRRNLAVRLVELMKIAPCHQQGHDLGLAGPGGELQHVTCPVGEEHVP